MPLVQVDLPRPLLAEKGTALSEELHRALIDSLEIPADDKFQIFRPRDTAHVSKVSAPSTDVWPQVDRRAETDVKHVERQILPRSGVHWEDVGH